MTVGRRGRPHGCRLGMAAIATVLAALPTATAEVAQSAGLTGQAVITAPVIATPSASPTVVSPTVVSPTAVSPTVVSMAFSGDVLLHRPIIAQALVNGGGRSYDFIPMLARIAPIVSSVDLAVCHLETPIAPPGEPLSGHPIYGVPRQIAPALAATGYDRCSTASNHSMDRGAAGIDATVDALDAAGLGSSGMARTPQEAGPQVFTVKSVRFSHLAYTYGLNGLLLPPGEPWRVRLLDADRIVADARLARERGAEYVFVTLHWGQERFSRITDEQRTLADALTASGAVDLVVGEHVHVLQPIEQRNGHWVVYGTSNLISNLPGGDPAFPPSSQDGDIVTLSVTRRADGTFVTSRPVVHPTWVDHDGYIVRPVLEDLADPSTTPGVRAALEGSLARTREVLGDYVAPATDGPIPARCASEPPATVPTTAFTLAHVTSRYVPLDPVRIYDSRDLGDAGYLCPAAAVTVPIAGHGGVPASGASAVVLNVTAIAAGRAGFVSVWPSGVARPTVSSLNLTAVGQIRPNLVIVPLGEGGAVNVYSQSGAHVAIDVAGYFASAASSTDGRLRALAPARVLDTRLSTSPAGGARVDGDHTIAVPIRGRSGVPTTGASAVVVNLTATDARTPGFVTAWPTGITRPVVSNVNVAGSGDTAANLAVVRLGSDGSISLYAQAAMHLVVDVAGYITDGTAATSTDGLFVPLSPERLFDTREPAPVAGKLAASGTVTLPLVGRAGIPDTGVAAVALNVTAVNADAAGFVTVHPAGGPRPDTSTLNVVAGDVRPNAAVVKLGTGGALSFFTQSGAHLVADATGYFVAGAGSPPASSTRSPARFNRRGPR